MAFVCDEMRFGILNYKNIRKYTRIYESILKYKMHTKEKLRFKTRIYKSIFKYKMYIEEYKRKQMYSNIQKCIFKQFRKFLYILHTIYKNIQKIQKSIAVLHVFSNLISAFSQNSFSDFFHTSLLLSLIPHPFSICIFCIFCLSSKCIYSRARQPSLHLKGIMFHNSPRMILLSESRSLSIMSFLSGALISFICRRQIHDNKQSSSLFYSRLDLSYLPGTRIRDLSSLFACLLASHNFHFNFFLSNKELFAA